GKTVHPQERIQEKIRMLQNIKNETEEQMQPISTKELYQRWERWQTRILKLEEGEDRISLRPLDHQAASRWGLRAAAPSFLMTMGWVFYSLRYIREGWVLALVICFALLGTLIGAFDIYMILTALLSRVFCTPILLDKQQNRLIRGGSEIGPLNRIEK